MSDKVVVKGLDELKRAMADAASDVHKGAEQAIAEEVAAIEEDARRLAPRKTGALRRGIKADPDGLSGSVKSTARHATFVEHGTFKDKAQPYMTPAANLSRRRLPKRASQILRKFLEGR